MNPSAFANEHALANASALPHYAAFAGHRTRLTALVTRASRAEQGSLCVLGAGNAFDLDLAVLADRYAAIYLVDIDAAAVAGAIARQTPTVQDKLRAVAPLDVSGLLARSDRWARGEITPDELTNHAAQTARDVTTSIGTTFDVVVSTCLLSQLQLDVVRGFGDQHPLFQVMSWTSSVTHLRTLAALTKPGGKAILAVDVTADSLYPLGDVCIPSEGLELLDAATQAGKIFDFADPRRIESVRTDDPVLAKAFPRWHVADAWIWHNGPTTRFLVYGAVLPRV